jgi:carboxyl-terminal processing protease
MMMSGKILRSTVLIFACLFESFAVIRPHDELPEQQKLLVAIGSMLEHDHYSPRIIDDAFSKEIWTKYIVKLDPRKELFLQEDIDLLRKYDVMLDDEIHGKVPVSFLPAVLEIYKVRLDELRELQKQLLSVPFQFSQKEELLPNGSMSFPLDRSERQAVCRKRVKYMVLDNLANLQEANQKGDSPDRNTDEQLEKSAVNEAKQFNDFVNVIVRQMDPHSDYFPPLEKRGFEESISNRFYGIGAQLEQVEDGLKIVELEPGSPALKSGAVEVNDLIVGVGQDDNGEISDVSGMPVTEAVKLIRGTKESSVRITLKKQDGTLKTITMIRDEIVQEDAFARAAIVMKGDQKIGYIFLPKFYDDFSKADGAHCAADVAKALISLNKENVAGIIIDLRYNGGGSLQEVIRMVGLFIKGGAVVQVRGKNGEPVILRDQADHHLYNGPLAVMVNELSASAAEIFTAAIQDYHRGIVIGSSSTYGKGTVQKPYALGAAENGILKLTFEKFYRVSGASTQLKGVTPDIILPDLFDYQKIREKDNPAALPWDTIPNAGYQTWDGTLNIARLRFLSDQRIKKNPAFNTIHKNVKWLVAKQEQPISLNSSCYKKMLSERKKINGQNENAVKLSAEAQLNLKPLSKPFLKMRMARNGLKN